MSPEILLDDTCLSPQQNQHRIDGFSHAEDEMCIRDRGNIIKAGTTSPYSLYSESLASFTTGDLYDHHDADGFITLFGLPLKVRAMKMAEVESARKGQ